MDFPSIKQAAAEYLPQMTRFLRDLIAIPGESCGEEGVIRRIQAEMQQLNFDRAEIDPQGNVLGYLGAGERIIAFDAHIDTVGLGELANWQFDPYQGYETETEIGGRGASDQLGGIVAAVYGARIMRDLNLLPPGFTALVTGTVQEEDCDGLCWQYIYNEDKIKPEFVVITEPTDEHIYRGQRGRMEIRVEVKGVSCHGSAPERGDNAIYKMAEIILELRALNERLSSDPFLGQGTLAVSQQFYNSPSRCAVADMAAVSIDRRLTWGETWEGALEEIRALPTVQKYGAEVSMYDYDAPSWQGLVYPTQCYFPAWVVAEEHPAVQAAANAHRGLYGQPVIDKWTFSTNGVSICGRYGIPCVGYGPGMEAQAHSPNEMTYKRHLVKCAAVYAAIPALYAEEAKS
jgi:putative selenium metabolism hydrolase